MRCVSQNGHYKLVQHQGMKMAEGLLFVCNHCQHQIEAWSDGNPYYFDDEGAKHYAYHPDPLFESCVGNEVPYICLQCGHSLMSDTTNPTLSCPSCQSENIVKNFHLEGRPCPYCSQGAFARDPDFYCIS